MKLTGLNSKTEQELTGSFAKFTFPVFYWSLNYEFRFSLKLSVTAAGGDYSFYSVMFIYQKHVKKEMLSRQEKLQAD